MLEIDPAIKELLDSVEPPLPHELRKVILQNGLADTHKDAHEGFVGPYLESRAAQAAAFAALKLEVVS